MRRPLSKRLSEVLRLAAIGKTDKEIAAELNIGVGTVATHWKRLRLHFGTSSRTEVVARVLAQDSVDRQLEDSNERQRLLYEIAERERVEHKLREVNAQMAEVIRSREELLSRTMMGYEQQQTRIMRRLEELENLNRLVCDFGIIANEGYHGNTWRKTWISEAMQTLGYSKEEYLSGDMTIFNTIVAEEGKLKGYNTDASGALRALKEGGALLDGHRVLVLGSGGAARAIAFALATGTGLAGLTILGIEDAERQKLVKDLRDKTGVPVEDGPLTLDMLRNWVPHVRTLIHCTPVGMSPKIDESCVPANLFRPELTVMDIVYNPRETKLLQEAKAGGCRTISGLEMFLNQAVLQFELWTKQPAPVDIMRHVLESRFA